MTTIPEENSYLALLSFAEGFRTTTPPDLKSCLQCLLAVINLNVDFRSKLKTHLHIIKIILNNTDNILVAQTHCEKAWQLSQNVTSSEDLQLKLETYYLMATIHERNVSALHNQILISKVSFTQLKFSFFFAHSASIISQNKSYGKQSKNHHHLYIGTVNCCFY